MKQLPGRTSVVAKVAGVAVCVVVLGITSLRLRAAVGRPAPGELFEVTRRDVGKIGAGDRVELSFPLTNSGSTPLTILGVDGDCGCIQPEFPRELAAGARGEVKVVFVPLSSWSGKVEKQLRVRLGSQPAADIRLTVAADVTPFVSTIPAGPITVTYRPGETYRRKVQLSIRKGVAMELGAPQLEASWLKASLRRNSTTAEGSYELSAELGPFRRPGDQTTLLRIPTNEPRCPSVSIVVMALASSGPVVSPTDLSGRVVDPGDKDVLLGRLQVFTRSGSLKLLGLKADSSGIGTRVSPVRAGQFYEVAVTYPGGLKSGDVRSLIHVRTDDARTPVIDVPVRFTVR